MFSARYTDSKSAQHMLSSSHAFNKNAGAMNGIQQ
jgi:hypothetical protein